MTKWHAVPLDSKRMDRLLDLIQGLQCDARLEGLGIASAFLLSLDIANLTELLSIITDKEPEEVAGDFSLREVARALNEFLDMDVLGPYLGLQIERGYKIFGEAG